MCAHYENLIEPVDLRRYFQVDPPLQPVPSDVWPGYQGTIIRRAEQADRDNPAAAAREAVAGRFGLVAHWVTDLKLARYTYNARTETVASKPSFRDAWRGARHCIIAAKAIYEPDWRSGRAVATRITRSDGHPMGLAGLWETRRNADGSWLHSFTMLTINADGHALMQNFHRPEDEKRMVVVLPEAAYDDWLHARAQESMAFMRPYPAEALVAQAGSPASRR
jgi:putative SOS response-associated peptidase YedK